MTMLYQCDLSSGSSKTRAYIPAKGAKIGSSFKLKDSDDPEKMWTVESVSDIGIDEKYLAQLNIWNRDQRKGSDI